MLPAGEGSGFVQESFDEYIIANALSHRYWSCMRITVTDLSRSEYDMPTSNRP